MNKNNKTEMRAQKTKEQKEKKHLQLIEKITNDFKEIDKEMVKNIKTFISTDEEADKTNIIEIMIENGKDRKNTIQ